MNTVIQPSLFDLKKTFSSALYSYLRITNLHQSYEQFIADPSKPPVFQYSADISLASANRRLKKLRSVLEVLDPAHESEVAFIQWRIAETLVLKHFINLKSNKKRVTEKEIVNYIQMQTELYGPLDEQLFGGVMHSLRSLSRRRGKSYTVVMDEIERMVGPYPNGALYTPKEATFLHYKHLFSKCFPQLHQVLANIRRAEQYPMPEIIHIFEQAIEAVGATSRGWEVVEVNGAANVVAAKYRRKIMIGRYFHPTSTFRFKQIIAHEVGCHVQRSLMIGSDNHPDRLDEHDEGLAIMLEQLFGPRFMHKRAIRYFAVGLAVGADGQRRDFCEVYDILWRAIYITNQDRKLAKKQAFFETARAFRGGLPNVAGMAFLKDKIYLESNLAVWRKLEENLLDVEAFRRLFKGPYTKFSKEVN